VRALHPADLTTTYSTVIVIPVVRPGVCCLLFTRRAS